MDNCWLYTTSRNFKCYIKYWYIAAPYKCHERFIYVKVSLLWGWVTSSGSSKHRVKSWKPDRLPQAVLLNQCEALISAGISQGYLCPQRNKAMSTRHGPRGHRSFHPPVGTKGTEELECPWPNIGPAMDSFAPHCLSFIIIIIIIF